MKEGRDKFDSLHTEISINVLCKLNLSLLPGVVGDVCACPKYIG